MIGNTAMVQMEKDHGSRPRRTRLETQRIFHGANSGEKKTLELDGVVNVLSAYSHYDGGINCSICGKLYKSKVCFTKHLWEHSVYWDQFNDEKNHDRVLSIQAALIMYSRFHADSATAINSLLVTSPHQNEKRKDTNNNNNNGDDTEGYGISGVTDGSDRVLFPKTPEKKRRMPNKLRSPRQKPRTQKRSCSASSMSSLPGSVSPTFSLSDMEMSPAKSARQM